MSRLQTHKAEIVYNTTKLPNNDNLRKPYPVTPTQTDLTSDLITLLLRVDKESYPSTDVAEDFPPGCLIDLEIDAQRRPYSVASVYEGDSYIYFLFYIRIVRDRHETMGHHSGWLMEWATRKHPGAVSVTPPYRMFPLDEKETFPIEYASHKPDGIPIQRKVFVATGTGIAPFIRYYEWAAQWLKRGRMYTTLTHSPASTILWSVKDSSDVKGIFSASSHLIQAAITARLYYLYYIHGINFKKDETYSKGVAPFPTSGIPLPSIEILFTREYRDDCDRLRNEIDNAFKNALYALTQLHGDEFFVRNSRVVDYFSHCKPVITVQPEERESKMYINEVLENYEKTLDKTESIKITKYYAAGFGDMLRSVGSTLMTDMKVPSHLFAYEAFTA